MILYHGSKKQIEKLEKRQASAKEGVLVPNDELQDAIYFTPSREGAMAMAARPDGLTEIEGKTIWFEHPEKFNPDLDIYLYSINLENINPAFLEQCEDEGQYIYKGDSLIPENIEKLKAIEITKYFDLLNWESKEKGREKTTESQFKIR